MIVIIIMFNLFKDFPIEQQSIVCSNVSNNTMRSIDLQFSMWQINYVKQSDLLILLDWQNSIESLKNDRIHPLKFAEKR